MAVILLLAFIYGRVNNKSERTTDHTSASEINFIRTGNRIRIMIKS
jgi:hypothetical protein